MYCRNGLESVQSSHPFDRDIASRVYSRIQTKKNIKMVNKVITPMAGPAVDSGFTKFGITPGGGLPTGTLERSVPGGRLPKLMMKEQPKDNALEQIGNEILASIEKCTGPIAQRKAIQKV